MASRSTAVPANMPSLPTAKGVGLASSRNGSDWSLATLDPETPQDATSPGRAALAASGAGRVLRRPVALCSHSLERNGANNCVLFLATRLVEDQRVIIVTPKEGPMREDFEALGCTVVHLPTEVDDYEAKMTSVIVECGLVLANTMMRAEVVCLAKDAGVPSLWVIHEAWPRDEMKAYAEKTFLTSHITPDVIELAFTKASRIVFPAHVQRKLYEGLFHPDRASVVYNGIPLGKLDAAAAAMDRDEERAKLGVSKDEFLVLHLGTICKRKGQVNTARAFTRLVKRDGLTNAKLVLVGARYIRQHEIDYIDEIKKTVRKAGVEDRVSIIDIQKDVRRFYLAADVILVPSLNEVLPLVICESMAMRRPVVASRIDGIPEAMTSETEGLLIKPNSATAIADAVARLYRDPALREAMGERGRQRVLRQFSFDAMTGEYRSMIDSLALPPSDEEKAAAAAKLAPAEASTAHATASAAAATASSDARVDRLGLVSFGSTPELDARGPATPALSVLSGRATPSPLFTPSMAGSMRSAASFGSLSSLPHGEYSTDDDAAGADSDAASDFSNGGRAMSGPRRLGNAAGHATWASGGGRRRRSRPTAAVPSAVAQPFATLVDGAPVLVIPPETLRSLAEAGNAVAVPLDAAVAAGLAPAGITVPARPSASPAAPPTSSSAGSYSPMPPAGTRALPSIAEAPKPNSGFAPPAAVKPAVASGGPQPPAPASGANPAPASAVPPASAAFSPVATAPSSAAPASDGSPAGRVVPSLAADTSSSGPRPSAGVILVDMDSTLVDFDAAFIERWALRHPDRAEIDSSMIRSRALYELEANFPAEMRDDVIATIAEPGLFLAMPPIDGALEGMRGMLEAGFDVRIVTAPHPSCYATCAAEKFTWVARYLGPDWCSRLIIARDKTHIRGSILVDDKPAVRGSQTPAWQHVLFSQPWNRHISDCPRLATWHEWPQMVVSAMSKEDDPSTSAAAEPSSTA